MNENKFKYVMNKLFPNTNQDFTFNNFDKYIDKDSELDKKGIYVIKIKKNAKISIVEDLDFPEGPKKYEKWNKKKKIFEVKDLKDFGKKNEYNTREEYIYKLNNSDNIVLYIGKTDRTIKKRLTEYKDFGFGKYHKLGYGNDITNVKHAGGKRIWFIKDNKSNLVIDYISIDKLKKDFSDIYDKAEEFKIKLNKILKEKGKTEKTVVEVIEAGLICLHEDSKYGYDCLPFANEKFECEDIKDDWKDFWGNKYFC